MTHRFFIPMLTALLAVLSVSLTACAPDDEGSDSDGGFDQSEVLSDFSERVVVPTYAWLAQEALELQTAVNALADSPDETRHEQAREAWVATRKPWEQSEGFLFGPVDTLGLDPALDTWPVNKTDLDAVLASGDALTVEYVANLDPSLKGFHTIEYLLFGESASKDIGDFTAREFEYLTAVTAELATNADTLADSWTHGVDGADPYADVFSSAGENAIYPSLASAAQEIVEGMIGICDEVANGKIADPFDSQDTSLVESQFSFNSLADFTDNLNSVRNAYLGDVPGAGSEGVGLNEYVAAQDSDLDARIQDGMEASIAALGAIPWPFRDAILDADAADEIVAAQEAINDLRIVLESELLPLILE